MVKGHPLKLITNAVLAVRRFALPIAASRTVKLSDTVATVGFPDIGLQGFAPKVLAHGHHGGNRVAGGRGG
jgi:hypothetical protein